MVPLYHNNPAESPTGKPAATALLLIATALLFALGGCAAPEHYWYKKLPEPEKKQIASAVPHVVQEGERISDIAERYGVEPVDIIEYNKIDLEDAPDIPLGTRLMIPRGVKEAVGEAVTLEKDADSENARPKRPDAEGEPFFVCPVPGPIVNGFNDQSENGINAGVDIAAPAGADVIAAKTGVVIACTDKPQWGKVVIIDHGKGEHTFYAHLGHILVHKGQVVKQRQTIGTIAAGNKPTLHFRIYREGKTIDPYGRFPRY